MKNNSVFAELLELSTEQINPNTTEIDLASIEEILLLINQEDKSVSRIVKKEIPYIARAVEIIEDAFRRGGRLFYIGAGTSGRLGVLDAAECPPTFGTSPELIQGIIAGGYGALIRAKEGAEDKESAGVRDLKRRGFNKSDVVCGLAASRRTPYVLGALEEAKRIGGRTIYITCNSRSSLTIEVDVAICPVVGPEVIMGSTRMKAGTAQKLVLNMLSTAVMIRIGKIYKNLMVDLQMNSQKLEERSKRIVMTVTGIDYRAAEIYLKRAGGSVKTALVMILGNVPKRNAVSALRKSDGHIRKALDLLT